MVRGINSFDIKNITWFTSNSPLKETELNQISKLPFFLPDFYIELLRISNGGEITQSVFNYHDEALNDNVTDSIGTIYSISDNKYNIFDAYFSPPEFFPDGILAFADTGGGNRICFDYRSNPKSFNPPIVYWRHDSDIGEDVSFVAKDFEEFLSILEEPDDLDEI